MSPAMKHENIMDNYTEDNYQGISSYDEDNLNNLKIHYYNILKLLGEDPKREGLLKTPERVAKAMQFLTHGYDANPEQVLRSALFRKLSEMVIVKDIEVIQCVNTCCHFRESSCYHIPNGTIVGLSKIPRCRYFCKTTSSARATYTS